MCLDPIIGLTFIVVGIFVLTKTLFNARLHLQSMSWANVQGEVIRSSYTDRTDPEGDRDYVANIEYLFVVDGVSYHSTKLKIGFNNSSVDELTVSD